ncbi:MAG: tetratricopeptide repeat protein [Burkholderiales bacterium]|nr:MAG: tetratricopeptide repeat protein [Burkholderiales bacterium]
MKADLPLPPPAVRLLGVPSLAAGGVSTPLTADRAHLLLALLACRRDWVRRDELADLLYPGRDIERARSNLRKLIHLARKVAGDDALEQQADLLRWQPDSDLARFERACDQREAADAVALYGGPLLQGSDSHWPVAAQDWLDAERQRLQSRWHAACLQRLGELAGAPETQLDLAHQMLRHDPLDDVALQALVTAEQALGRPEAARRAMAEYAHRIGAEWKLEPSAAVQRIDRALREGVTAQPAPLAPRLIGRRLERQRVNERLQDPACRLLTLLGPPGVGKSVFARQLAQEQGAVFVELEALDGAEAVAVAMATALGLKPDGRRPRWAGLAEALGPRDVLVVLDNAEAIPIAEPLAGLLAACAGLRVLVTSRAPLDLAGEWRLPLDGLPLPDLDERDPEVLRANDAVALFEQRARPLAPGFQLAAEAADVVRLVHEVEGLPLAIELLAGWRRLMPVSNILSEFNASLELLEGTSPGERSVRSAFEQSWRRLVPAAQQALAGLALLPSPCDREMVRQVVQAPLPVLAYLTDRSMLRADEQGRFTLHPLIRRCAAALAEGAEGVLERHARHVAQTLGRSEVQLGAQLPHALAAWDWAVAQADAAVLDALATTLDAHLCRRGRWHDGLSRAAAACSALAGRQGVGRDDARARARCHLFLAHMEHGSGRFDEALSHADAAAALARQHDLAGLQGECADLQGRILWQRGDYAAAEQAYQTALQAALAARRPDAQRRASSRLGLVAKSRGDFATALRHYEHALEGFRRDGTLADNLYLPVNLGNLLRVLGRLDEALPVLQEALDLARASGTDSMLPFLLTNLVLVHEQAGRLAPAAELAEQACETSRQFGEPIIEGAARLARARIRARRTQSLAALDDVHATLAIADRLHAVPLRVQAISTGGLVLAACGDTAAGLDLVGWAMAQAEFAPSEHDDARRHLRAMGLPDPAHPIQPTTPARALMARLAQPGP